MKILGIETSCDDTAVAIITDSRQILANEVLSQTIEHMPYGGVVPEIASRAHMNALDSLITTAMQHAGIINFRDLDGIAVTAGPGLIGGVIVGVMMAKGIAAVTGVPIIPVNHLEGHALTIRLTDPEVKFPFLLLLVSGGHCQVLKVKNTGEYEKLGATLDDALGEAFDKVAKMLGLGYPGGPAVEQRALMGNRLRFHFPRPLLGHPSCNFSFSGLKTAVKRQVDQLRETAALNTSDINDICASFQHCVGNIIVDRMQNAINLCRSSAPEIDTLVVAGGVAANKYIREILILLCDQNNFKLKAPPINLCTDNGAMIAWAGIENLKIGKIGDMSFAPRARWPL